VAKDTSAAISEAASKLGQVTANELRSLRELMKSAGQTLTSTTSKNVLKGIGIAAGLIFTVIDVTLLIRNWKNPHPLVLSIQNIVEDLVQDVVRCEESMSVLQRLGNSPEYSLPQVFI
jgi:hypothetical protein